MRSWTRWVGTVVVGLALTACGGGSGGNAALTTAQIHSRLLNAADVGAAWKTGQAINAQDLAAFAQAPCESARTNQDVARRLTAVAGAQFEPVDRSYRHLIELVVTGSRDQLDNDLHNVFSTIESCNSGGASSATGPKTAVKKLAIRPLGDQQAAYTVIQTTPLGSANALSLRAAYVRLGSVAVMVGLFDFQTSAEGASQVSDDAFRAIVAKATAKLRAT